MNQAPGPRALAASTLALVVSLSCIALFLPPLVAHTVSSPLRTVVVGLLLTCALLLHWIFLGLGVRRMTRSVAGWVSLSVLLFPVGSVLALVLLSWLDDEARGPAAAQHG